jgi:hypothetical protein
MRLEEATPQLTELTGEKDKLLITMINTANEAESNNNLGTDGELGDLVITDLANKIGSEEILA